MRNLNLITNINNRRNGYTIIEVAVVILIIGILTAISIISYGSWKQKTVATQLKSDLTMAASAMKDARTFGTSGYPSDITNVKSFKPSGNTGDVVVTGGSNDGGKTFCLSAEAPSYPSLHYHIDSTHTISEVESGTCPTYITNVAISPPTDIRVGQVLTAAVTPTGATDTATYQWRRYNSIALDNNYVVVGTSQKTYTTTSGDLAKYIRVAATGTGEYTGSVTSSHTTVVQPALSSLSGISYTGTPIVGNILTAGAPQPPSATANLQW
ncbi:MAG: type II secretion system protein, partial [Candidatus Saccharibacteria bacterium]